MAAEKRALEATSGLYEEEELEERWAFERRLDEEMEKSRRRGEEAIYKMMLEQEVPYEDAQFTYYQ